MSGMTADQERQTVKALCDISTSLNAILWELRAQNEDVDRCQDCLCPALVETEGFGASGRKRCQLCGWEG